MNIKNEKGFTGADVTVAILIVTIFAGVIASLYQNYVTSATEIERRAQATNYAVNVIEEIKKNENEYFTGDNEEQEEITVYTNEPIEGTGYSKTAVIEDYASLEGNEDVKARLCKNSKC